jgi:alpha-L-fucosidase
LVGFKELRVRNFKNNIARSSKGYFIPHNGSRPAPALHDANTLTSEKITFTHLQSMGLEFTLPEKINCIVLNEDLLNGQSCSQYRILLMNKNHEVLKEIKGTTIGRKRIVSFPATENVSIVGLVIDEQKKPTAISEIEVYLMEESITDN